MIKSVDENTILQRVKNLFFKSLFSPKVLLENIYMKNILKKTLKCLMKYKLQLKRL